ncbi:unnamed protein product [Rhodiola kirilowii]
MDWSSSKGPSWDWPELDQQQQQQQSFLPNNIDATGTGGGNFSVDLNLGSVTGSQTQLGISVPLPSKRARAASQQTTFCLVDDCSSDLSNCRDYHRRHKVCEVHSKTPEVTILGKKQRFCQQCSRFHGLDEFDEGKRSCRKRLDGHNRRRRKSQPETPLQQGIYLPNLPGGAGMLSFTNPSSSSHSPPALSSVIRPTTWSVPVNQIEDPYNKQEHMNSLADYSYREAKRLTFLQGEPSDHKAFYASTQSPDSTCALSLLSPPMHATTEMYFRNTIPTQPLNHASRQTASHFSTLQRAVPGSEVKMFQTGPDEPQTLPFYWE